MAVAARPGGVPTTRASAKREHSFSPNGEDGEREHRHPKIRNTADIAKALHLRAFGFLI
jgi:hypothetical protein